MERRYDKECTISLKESFTSDSHFFVSLVHELKSLLFLCSRHTKDEIASEKKWLIVKVPRLAFLLWRNFGSILKRCIASTPWKAPVERDLMRWIYWSDAILGFFISEWVQIEDMVDSTVWPFGVCFFQHVRFLRFPDSNIAFISWFLNSL